MGFGERSRGGLPTVSRRRAGAALVLLAVLGYALFVGVSAATAPRIGDAADGDETRDATLVGTQGPFNDRQGRIVALDAGGDVVWESAERWAHMDVSPLANGSVLGAFLERGYEDCGPYDAPCSRTGFQVVDPSPEPRVVREWTVPVRHHTNSEVHDAELLSSGEVVLVDMERERVLTVNQSGAVTWQWNASEHYDAPADPTRSDWLHINDVDRIGEDRFLVSVRNENQLVVLERGEGVVEVVNDDGDPSVMNEQHNPQWLGPGAVLVADSENDRVVELHERDGEWEVVWEVHSAGGVAFHWPRDADRLPNGNTLITDSLNDRIVEVDASGEVVWSARAGPIPYEADRVPGEYPAGPPINATDQVSLGYQREDVPIPGVTLLLGSAHGVLPLPHWFSEWHLVGLGVALLAALVGTVAWATGERIAPESH